MESFWIYFGDMSSEKIKLQVRVDRSMLSQAETVFEALGIDSGVAVRMFFRRVVAARGILFSGERRRDCGLFCRRESRAGRRTPWHHVGTHR